MSSPLNQPATQLEVLATRTLIAAVGKALVKKGVISGADVASELSPFIQLLGPTDPLLDLELKQILGTVVVW